MVGDQLQDRRVRLRAFDWLAEQVDMQGDVLPRRLLEKGFLIGDAMVPLLGPQGIWKPRVLKSIPLSITTVPGGPYDDSFSTEGLLLYRYRGTDPGHRDNVGLREAIGRRVPLVYFHLSPTTTNGPRTCGSSRPGSRRALGRSRRPGTGTYAHRAAVGLSRMAECLPGIFAYPLEKVH